MFMLGIKQEIGIWEEELEFAGLAAPQTPCPEKRRCDFSPGSGFLQMAGKLGMPEGIMAKIIEFYVPKEFRKRARWVPSEQRGQVIEFTLPKKSA
jgi:hypothetical protein